VAFATGCIRLPPKRNAQPVRFTPGSLEVEFSTTWLACYSRATMTITQEAPSAPTTSSAPTWQETIQAIGLNCAGRAAASDQEDAFVTQNYAELRAAKFFAAAIPAELGGGGVTHGEMCDLLRVLGQHCGSTALAASMHQHLLAAMTWRYRRGQGGEERLRMIAEKQPVLVSTGARDWLESNGSLQRTNGGYLLTGLKNFASQSASGDILVTSGVLEEADRDPEVLHFAIPFRSEGVTVLDNWCTLGMRGTGSHSVALNNVFVPESAITLRRPRGNFHPFFCVILTVAMPLIMSVYVGIAQSAARRARTWAAKQPRLKAYVAPSLAAMFNELTTAELAWRDMVRLANNLDFAPADSLAHEIVTRKAIAVNACLRVADQAMNIVGGAGFFREFGLERLFRDMQAAKYHPLTEAEQLQFSGDFLLQGRL
jgi:alkylation response protein AidB-like acyl-CoA dehydrogenase